MIRVFLRNIRYSTVLFCLVISFSAMSQGKWKSLYNGKSLNGWRPLNGKASFEPRGKEIVGTTVFGEPNSFLVTEELYSDFILEFEFKLDAEMNSGVQFRSESSADYQNGRVHGYQMEIDPSARAWTGGFYDEARRDWLYTLEYNPVGKTAYKTADWNQCRIECVGSDMRIWVNGMATSHVVDNMTPKGFIALQVHSVGKAEDSGKKIRWKNIRIQTENLKTSPPDDIFVVNLIPNTLSDPEARMGTKLLWDGRTSSGWRGAYQEKFPDKGWEIKDGVLSVLKAQEGAGHGGDVVSVDVYGAFDLQFEFKLEEGTNSGVKYFAIENEAYKGSAIGLEYQILDDAKHPDARNGVVGNRLQGSLYDLIPAIQVKRGQRLIGQWNWGRIVVYPDNRIEHWLNGYKVVEYQRGTPIYQALVARSKYAIYENFGMTPNGHILLQDHGDPVSFRSIKIREIK